MGIFEVAALFAVMVPVAAMPSASVALVVTRSLSCGPMSGVITALGIVAGDLVFVLIALLGMAVLAEHLGAFFVLLKYCGGGYLIYLGVRLLRAEPSIALGATKPSRAALVTDFFAGLVLTLGDIKAIFFYASLLPVLIDYDQVSASEIVAIVAVTFFAVGGVKLLYVAFSSKIAEHLRGKVLSSVPRKLGGTLMIACGSTLIAKA